MELAVKPKTWKRAFKRYNIDFGHYQESHIHRRNHDLLPRHLKPTHVKKEVSSLLPSSSPTAKSVSLDLGHSTGGSGSDFNFPIGPDVPFQIGCENCTTGGTLGLKQGSFDIEIDVTDLDSNNDGETTVNDFIRGGFVELTIDGFNARVLVHAIPTSTAEFAIDLFSIPTVSPLGFDIPGFGRAGLTFTPQLAASFTIESPVKFLMGFDVKVPDGAKLRVDLGDWEKSGQTGL
jgi:hypothetical protein